MYSSRHYADIASKIHSLKGEINEASRKKFALAFAEHFKHDNENFNSVRFLRACGYSVSSESERSNKEREG